jgi:hypothetical protein
MVRLNATLNADMSTSFSLCLCLVLCREEPCSERTLVQVFLPNIIKKDLDSLKKGRTRAVLYTFEIDTSGPCNGVK